MISVLKKERVICCNFCYNFLESVKELQEVPFSISIYNRIGKFSIQATSKQQTPNIKYLREVIQLRWYRYEYSCKP